MTRNPIAGIVVVLVMLVSACFPQSTDERNPSPDAAMKAWQLSLSVAGYIIPHDQSYVSPTFTADRSRLHLEARYNYEAQRTGSLWAGYNFSAGKRVEINASPMVGVVLGSFTGVSPGYNASLTYKRLELSTTGEFVFDVDEHTNSFFYSWTELSYSPADWFRAGLVAQRTKAYHTTLDVQRGFLIGFSRKRASFTTYVFNAGWTDPTVVISAAYTF